jgi:hypothetical protein
VHSAPHHVPLPLVALSGPIHHPPEPEQDDNMHAHVGHSTDMAFNPPVKVPSGTFVQSVRSFVESRVSLASCARQDQRFDKDKT